MHEFEANGYARTGMESVARHAGISTKTLYRIIPRKAELLRELVLDRFERFAVNFRLRVPEQAGIEEGLSAALVFCANSALHPEIVALQRIILQETSRFPQLAALCYEVGVLRAATALSEWLARQVERGLIRIDDCDEAAAALVGMIISAPQRAALFAGLPPPTQQQIHRRVRKCAAWFLDGCRIK